MSRERIGKAISNAREALGDLEAARVSLEEANPVWEGEGAEIEYGRTIMNPLDELIKDLKGHIADLDDEIEGAE